MLYGGSIFQGRAITPSLTPVSAPALTQHESTTYMNIKVGIKSCDLLVLAELLHVEELVEPLPICLQGQSSIPTRLNQE